MLVLRAGSALGCLLALACADRTDIPTEAETIDQFIRDRAGFEAIVRTVTAEPRILRIERRTNGELSILPSGADGDRVRFVAAFMERHSVIDVATDRSTEPSVDFTTFESEGFSRYESWMLTYRPGDRPSGLVVSTDAAIRSAPAVDQTVFQSLGDGWYIRASSFPVRD